MAGHLLQGVISLYIPVGRKQVYFAIRGSFQVSVGKSRKRGRREIESAWAGEGMYCALLVMMDDVLDEMNRELLCPTALSMKLEIITKEGDIPTTVQLGNLPHYHQQIAAKMRRIIADNAKEEEVNRG